MPASVPGFENGYRPSAETPPRARVTSAARDLCFLLWRLAGGCFGASFLFFISPTLPGSGTSILLRPAKVAAVLGCQLRETLAKSLLVRILLRTLPLIATLATSPPARFGILRGDFSLSYYDQFTQQIVAPAASRRRVEDQSPWCCAARGFGIASRPSAVVLLFPFTKRKHPERRIGRKPSLTLPQLRGQADESLGSGLHLVRSNPGLRRVRRMSTKRQNHSR